ncbi:hypothetical protein GMSM_44610 [Geomonas sp. Red276]
MIRRVMILGMVGLLAGCAVSARGHLDSPDAKVFKSAKTPEPLIRCISTAWMRVRDCELNTVMTEKGYILSVTGGFGPEATVGIEPGAGGSELRFGQDFYMGSKFEAAIIGCL